MLSLSSTGDVVHAVRASHRVALLAYVLRPGPVEDALLAAARRGAQVTVRLEGAPRFDPDGTLLQQNRDAVRALAIAGADARLVSGRTLHAKAIETDRDVFLDDRNWPADGEDTIVRDDFARDRRIVDAAVRGRDAPADACFAMHKREALAFEARLLANPARPDDVVVESESFGNANRVYAQLERLGDAGAAPRVLVSSRDLQSSPRERAAIVALERHGVRVRAIDADEKFALAGTRAWIGSANASAAFDRPDQLDWGARTDDATIVAALRARFEQRWAAASDVTEA